MGESAVAGAPQCWQTCWSASVSPQNSSIRAYAGEFSSPFNGLSYAEPYAAGVHTSLHTLSSREISAIASRMHVCTVSGGGCREPSNELCRSWQDGGGFRLLASDPILARHAVP